MLYFMVFIGPFYFTRYIKEHSIIYNKYEWQKKMKIYQ